MPGSASPRSACPETPAGGSGWRRSVGGSSSQRRPQASRRSRRCSASHPSRPAPPAAPRWTAGAAAPPSPRRPRVPGLFRKKMPAQPLKPLARQRRIIAEQVAPLESRAPEEIDLRHDEVGERRRVAPAGLEGARRIGTPSMRRHLCLAGGAGLGGGSPSPGSLSRSTSCSRQPWISRGGHRSPARCSRA